MEKEACKIGARVAFSGCYLLRNVLNSGAILEKTVKTIEVCKIYGMNLL